MATSIRNGGRRSRLQGSNSRGCSLVHLLLAVVTWVFLLLCWKHLRPNSSLQIRGDYEALLAEADALVAMYHNKSVVNGDTSRGVGGQSDDTHLPPPRERAQVRVRRQKEASKGSVRSAACRKGTVPIQTQIDISTSTYR